MHRRIKRRLWTPFSVFGPSQTFLTDLFEKNPDGVLHVAPTGRIVAANESAAQLLGERHGRLLGCDLRDCAFDPELKAAISRALVEARAGVPCDVEGNLDRTASHPIRVRIYLSPLWKGRKVTGILVVLRDITAQWEADQRLTNLAYTDDLTGLPNRNRFLEQLGEALIRNRITCTPLGVIYLDVDRFRVLNDTLGPRMGDQFLKEVADRLGRTLPSNATLARLASDEFAVLMPCVLALKQVINVAEQMQAQVEAPFHLDGHEFYATISAGIAMFWPGEAVSELELLRRADQAMRYAKRRGPGLVEVFAPTLKLCATDLRLEADLHHGLERGEFEVWYQPIISLASNQFAGVEALLRWRHPERGMVAPGQFIPIAEETGYILPLGRWVLQSAAEQLQRWRKAYPPARDLFLNVNLSPRQFLSRNIVSDVAHILRDTGLPPQNLSLEITESVLVPDEIGVLENLERLKELGVRLAVDDFGTGYSSLSYIKRLPVDQLKIDRAFVDGLGKASEDTAIVRAVITFAQTLRLSVVGEGIETMEQLRELKLLGCDRGQGYLFSRPVTAEDIERLLSAL